MAGQGTGRTRLPTPHEDVAEVRLPPPEQVAAAPTVGRTGSEFIGEVGRTGTNRFGADPKVR